MLIGVPTRMDIRISYCLYGCLCGCLWGCPIAYRDAYGCLHEPPIDYKGPLMRMRMFLGMVIEISYCPQGCR